MPDDRYTIQSDGIGQWSIVDIFTGFPAIVADRTMVRMSMEDADDMVDFINRLDRESQVEPRQ